MDKTFHIITFGCQMNVHDSLRMAELLKKDGWRETSSYDEASLLIFNTCTVRDHARHKAISEIGKAIQKKKRCGNLIVGITGCVAQAEKESLFKTYPHLDFVLGPDQISKIAEVAASVANWQARRVVKSELIDDLSSYNWTRIDAAEEASKNAVGSFVTIMKGCNNNCAYCIVPSVRGRELSRPAAGIVEDVKRLAKAGIKEVTLLGQNVNSYKMSDATKGKISGETSDFVRLLQMISSETDIARIRYTSPHPKDLGFDLMQEHATNPKLCLHMHLPLQAGSSKILRDMKRSYNKEQFMELAAQLRCVAKGIDITTDIIVGFPGESETDFCDTLEVVRAVEFDGMFAFKYSPREGTAAAKMNDDVPMEEKEERLQRLLRLNEDIWAKKTSALVGTSQQVLVEGASKNSKRAAKNENGEIAQLTGRNFGNKIVNLTGNFNLVGHIVSTKIIRAGANSLTGELI